MGEQLWTARCEDCDWTYSTPIRPLAEARLVLHAVNTHQAAA